MKGNKAKHRITTVVFCLIALLLSGCSTDMRKISVEPKISTDNLRKSSLRAGLVLDPPFTSYKHSFKTGVRVFMFSSVEGEMEIGKNLSQALYGIVSSKFGNVSLCSDVKDIQEVDLYLVPSIQSFNFSLPYTGYGSYSAEIELETDVFDKNGRLKRRISIKQRGTRQAILNQAAGKTNYEIAREAVNEAMDNALREFTAKLDDD